jgi:hypothetical protein
MHSVRACCIETVFMIGHLKEEALDRIKWRNRFGRGFGPVVWQITDDDDDNDDDDDCLIYSCSSERWSLYSDNVF